MNKASIVNFFLGGQRAIWRRPDRYSVSVELSRFVLKAIPLSSQNVNVKTSILVERAHYWGFQGDFVLLKKGPK